MTDRLDDAHHLLIIITPRDPLVGKNQLERGSRKAMRMTVQEEKKRVEKRDAPRRGNGGGSLFALLVKTPQP